MTVKILGSTFLVFAIGCGGGSKGNFTPANTAAAPTTPAVPTTPAAPPSSPSTGTGTQAPTGPTVAFVGDSITYSALQRAGTSLVQSSGWINDATDGPETSASMLARFPLVLAQKPTYVVIQAGMGDIVASVPEPDLGFWDATLCGEYTPAEPPVNPLNTCSNVDAMAQLAQAAGVKAIVADIANEVPIEGGGAGISSTEMIFYNLNFNKVYKLEGVYGSTGWDMAATLSVNNNDWTDDGGATLTQSGANAWIQAVDVQLQIASDGNPWNKPAIGLKGQWEKAKAVKQ